MLRSMVMVVIGWLQPGDRMREDGFVTTRGGWIAEGTKTLFWILVAILTALLIGQLH